MDSRTEEPITVFQATTGVYYWELKNPLWFKVTRLITVPSAHMHQRCNLMICRLQLVQYEGRFQLTNHRHFNLRSQYRSREYQCNVQSAKSSSDVKSYIEKGGEYEDWGEFQIDGRSARGSQTSAAEVYAEALNAESGYVVAEEKTSGVESSDPSSVS
ncbi:hypothetical protein RHGRI_013176 [Rhododendron griersonianum]|uniref:CRESS-DNA virus Rep endonuclease domain-containing protein n=1 Tax=Rhododendron griersonianum TaxID=479676 RepID=A0AAV6K4K9_9ERIC|nr:hypothetical protein RHGRI_013176 [Rhododendron griersonianum]